MYKVKKKKIMIKLKYSWIIIYNIIRMINKLIIRR